MGWRPRPAVAVSFAAFVCVGIWSGVSGVLLPAQMASYHVDHATIGLTFFAGAAGFALAGLTTGGLLHRFGFRATPAGATGLFVLVLLCLALRPPFPVFLAAQLVGGYGCGVLESTLNVYLAGLDGAPALLNRLHAFWGSGALIGPPLAAWLLGFTTWPVVYVVLAVAFVIAGASFPLAYPARGAAADVPESPQAVRENLDLTERSGASPERSPAGLLRVALRERGVLLGSVLLTVYVGLELGVGNWAYSYLTQARHLSGPVAGYLVSAYWGGLTLGRFVIAPTAARLRVPVAKMVYVCLGGITLATLAAWLAPTPVACVALALLGFCLAPVFPTTMAIAPRLTSQDLVPTSIGVMNSASTVGGSLLPWLMGLATQDAGMRALFPFALVLAVAQFAVWRPIATHLATSGKTLN